MTMRPVFGDFLAQASGHIATAVSIRDPLPDEDLSGVVRGLDRIVTTLASYVADVPLPEEFGQPHPGDGSAREMRAVREARIALRRSSQALRPAAATAQTGQEPPHPAAWHLARAAEQLAAGRDLLHTHFAADPSGAWTSTSSWGRVTYSPPIIDALLSEIGGLAAKLAPWMMRLSLEPPSHSAMPAATGLSLNDASRWLWIAGLRVETHLRQHAPSEPARLALAAIPPNLPPAYQPVDATETVPELCQGLVTTSARLQHAAFAFARVARWSPQATSGSWYRDALAAAITAHSSGVIVRTLAQRATDLGLNPLIQAHLDNSARALRPVCTAWRALSDEWVLLSTGANHGRGVSRVANEIGAMVLRVGRLAFSNPEWTPATSPARASDPVDLAPTVDDLRLVLAAIHHVVDTLTHIAVTDCRCVRGAAADGRVYFPTRLLPANNDIPHPYVSAPRSRITALLDKYHLAVKTSAAATAAFDSLSLAVQTPSHVLAVTRSAITGSTPNRSRAKPLDSSGPIGQPELYGPVEDPVPVGHLEDAVRSLHLTEPSFLLRAAAIDSAGRDLLAEAISKAKHQATASVKPVPHGRRPRLPRAL